MGSSLFYYHLVVLVGVILRLLNSLCINSITLMGPVLYVGDTPFNKYRLLIFSCVPDSARYLSVCLMLSTLVDLVDLD